MHEGRERKQDRLATELLLGTRDWIICYDVKKKTEIVNILAAVLLQCHTNLGGDSDENLE
jgi:hypothetical protein